MSLIPPALTPGGITARLRSLWRGFRYREAIEADMREEFRHHLELLTEDLMRREGLEREEAYRRARLEFGHVEGHLEDARASRGLRWLDRLAFSCLDVKLGLRMVARHPGLALVSTFALAVGIPVGLAPGHFVDGLMAPLPVPEGRQIRVLRLWSPAQGHAVAATTHDYEVWRTSLSTFEEIAAFRQTAYNIDAETGGWMVVRGAEVTASAFAVLRVAPLLGRPILPADEVPGAADVAVIGYDLWQSRYGGDPDIVGRSIKVGGVSRTVVGVMPKDFRFLMQELLWSPLRVAPGQTAESAEPVQIFGRLAEGVDDARASAEFAAVAARSAVPGREQRLQPQVRPFAHIVLPGMSGGLRASPEFLASQGLALLVILVACINVAMLVFARTTTRANELAVRTALGASRARIVTQVFVECLILTLLASGLGLLLLAFVPNLMLRVLPGTWAAALPYWIRWEIGLDTAVHALALAAVSAVVAGVVPALRFTGMHVQSTIQRTRAGRTGVRFGGLPGFLIAVDVAAAVAAVGFAMTAWDLVRRADSAEASVGIPADEYLAATIRLPSQADPASGAGPAGERRTRMASIQSELMRRLREEPQVRGVAVADVLPRMDHPTRRVEVEGVEVPDHHRGFTTRVARVAVDFFDSMGQPILLGRDFNAGDVGEDASAVIVNTTFVERVLGGGPAIGRRIRFVPRGDGEPGPWKEIVGVVGHLGMRLISPENDQGVYLPVAPGELETVRLAIHVRGEPLGFVPRLREVAADVAPDLIVSATGPLEDIYEGDWYLILALSLGAGLLVAILLALAASGIYAIMSFSVSARTAEIGIRSALGADRRDLIVLVARRAVTQIAVGVLIGMPLAALFLINDVGSRYVGAGRTLVVGILTMVVVGLAACTGPTLRALRIDPNVALKGEG